MNRNIEANLEANVTEQLPSDNVFVDVSELRALTFTEMDIVGGGNAIAFLD